MLSASAQLKKFTDNPKEVVEQQLAWDRSGASLSWG